MTANTALVEARTAARLSQRELANRVRDAGKHLGLTNGCNGTTVSRWEAGETPQPRMLAALEKALGMTAEALGFRAQEATSWLVPPGFPASTLAGYWVTVYQFPHGGAMRHHADIAIITAESDRRVRISNTMAARTEGRERSPFRNEIDAQVASRHLMGYWRNTSDTRYFGMVHLAVLQGENVMDGYYTGLDSDIVVSTAAWRWVRLDLPAEVTGVALLDPALIFKLIMEHSQYDPPLTLSDVGEEA